MTTENSPKKTTSRRTIQMFAGGVLGSMEGPTEFGQRGEQLPPGNPLGFEVGDLAVMSNEFIGVDGTILTTGSKVAIRSITPLPSVYLAVVQCIEHDDARGGPVEIKLAMLVRPGQ